MKINCLSCGHNIDLDDAYAEHYEGEIKCYGCNAALEIRTEQNAIRCVRLLSGPTAGTVSAEAYGQARAEEGAKARVEEGAKATVEEGAKARRARPDKVRNQAKPGAAALNESGRQYASPANNRAA